MVPLTLATVFVVGNEFVNAVLAAIVKVPSIVDVVTFEKDSVRLFAAVAAICKVLPVAIDKSNPLPPPILKLTPAPLCKLILVFPATKSWPIVCVVTPVATVPTAPLLNTKMSSFLGVVLLGVQFVAVTKLAVPVWFQT